MWGPEFGVWGMGLDEGVEGAVLGEESGVSGEDGDGVEGTEGHGEPVEGDPGLVGEEVVVEFGSLGGEEVCVGGEGEGVFEAGGYGSGVEGEGTTEVDVVVGGM